MLASEPDNALVRFGLANEYLKEERYEEAIDAFEKYLANSDDEGAAFGMLARAYEKVGLPAKAREMLARGIEAATLHNHPSMAEEYKSLLDGENGL